MNGSSHESIGLQRFRLPEIDMLSLREWGGVKRRSFTSIARILKSSSVTDPLRNYRMLFLDPFGLVARSKRFHRSFSSSSSSFCNPVCNKPTSYLLLERDNARGSEQILESKIFLYDAESFYLAMPVCWSGDLFLMYAWKKTSGRKRWHAWTSLPGIVFDKSSGDCITCKPWAFVIGVFPWNMSWWMVTLVNLSILERPWEFPSRILLAVCR